MTRRRGQRGFTLAELMISLGLSSIVAAGVLMLTRAQLRAYDLNDSVVKAQQNARVGLEFIETQLRRACGGVSSGQVALFVPGIAPGTVKSCVQWYDSAVTSSGTFGTSGTTGPDAIEIIYGYANTSSSFASTDASGAFSTTTPVINVTELTGFAVGDLALVTDWKYGNLFKVATINGGATPATGAGTLGFATLSASAPAITGFSTLNGVGVLKATSMALYLVGGSGVTPSQLYYDPDGMLSTNHANAQPLIDGVADFQLAFGIDHSAVAPANGTADDGVITESAVVGRSAGNDEWIGNFAGETLPATPWNLVAATAPTLLQIRATLVVRTTNAYPEPTNNVPASEDGAIVNAALSNGRYPRYRSMRTIVAPREWNLGE